MGFGLGILGTAIGGGLAYATGGSSLLILGGASLGGSIGGGMDASNANRQANDIRIKIADSVKQASIAQIAANNSAGSAGIGFQQSVISGIQGSESAVKQASNAALIEIKKQTGLVESQSQAAGERTTKLTSEQASAIREQAGISASALEGKNAQIEALARAFSAASGVTSAGTPTIYTQELVKTDARRVQDIVDVGDRNALLVVQQGQNLVAEIQASAELAQARLHAQATNITGQFGVSLAGMSAQIEQATAQISVIAANNAVNNANVEANAAQYGVSLADSGAPKKSDPKKSDPKKAAPYQFVVGDKRSYR